MNVLTLAAWVLLWTVTGIFALLAALLAALLFLPVDLRARADADMVADEWAESVTGPLRWAGRVRWGWVLLVGELAGENTRVERAEWRLLGRRLGGRKEGAPRKARRKGRKPLEEDLRKAFFRELARFARRLWQALGFGLKGDVVYGLADPSLTGVCQAVLSSIGLPRAVRIEPEFLGPKLSGWLQADGRLYGVQVLSAAWTGLRNPVLRKYVKERIRTRLVRARPA